MHLKSLTAEIKLISVSGEAVEEDVDEVDADESKLFVKGTAVVIEVCRNNVYCTIRLMNNFPGSRLLVAVVSFAINGIHGESSIARKNMLVGK